MTGIRLAFGILLGLLAAVLILLLALLLIPFHLTLTKDEHSDFQIFLRFLFLRFPLNKLDHGKADREIRKAEKDAAAKPAPGLADKLSALGFTDTVSHTLNTVSLLLDRFLRLLGHIRTERLIVHAVIGGDDAAETAMAYGKACSVFYPVLAYWKERLPCRPNRTDTSLTCDFTLPTSRLSFLLTLRLRLIFPLLAVLTLWFQRPKEDISHEEKTSCSTNDD